MDVCLTDTLRRTYCTDLITISCVPFSNDSSSLRAFFQFIAASRWLGFRMDSIMYVLLVLVSFLVVVVQQTGKILISQLIRAFAFNTEQYAFSNHYFFNLIL